MCARESHEQSATTSATRSGEHGQGSPEKKHILLFFFFFFFFMETAKNNGQSRGLGSGWAECWGAWGPQSRSSL